ncbi:3-oxoacyl-ACP reductase [Colwellia sp. 4_MG-2023]|uniref:3-oxoacyl-ACP reductase n=1 Tax=unclassified Colwellia TaxID=196834 RepID=UPI0026E1310E|nr:MULTISPECIES: 3-oxoacyl-ACP reductase [unclassified Colwellia]MDO6505442.1 3-oxoacyl-ACP reductase [Colwellia sp. 5_MG-2023]MDO6554262.1 3-oxoacyl-ACP reductase [Colwellia sp. 4_MG-2023]
MSLTNKFFSLLGFPEPIALQRFNSKNSLPENVALLSISQHINPNIEQALFQLPTHIIKSIADLTIRPIKAVIIDATDYLDESSYQQLYTTIKSTLKQLDNNAKILIIAHPQSTNRSEDENTFSQSLIGFSKSLAKEVGRKGSTTNVIFINDEAYATHSALSNPINFFLSSKSSFISGQTLTINAENNLITPPSVTSKIKKTAVVTGVGQGIGAAIATKLSDDGYFVIGIDIEPMKIQLNKVMNTLQGESVILDVSAKEAGNKLVTLAQKHGGFDLIVHNAGITRDKTLAKMSENFWQQTLNINLLAVMRINKTLLYEQAINPGGRIICLSSMNGIAGQGGQTNYACSKAGIIGYVQSMNTKLAREKITINAIAPGFIETQMTKKMPFFTREMGRRMNALGQGGLPIDVAEAVSFLGDEHSFAISGQTLRVCGLNIIGA